MILRGDVDVTQSSATALLHAARYVGVLRAKPTDARSLEGAGMRFWLGDEDNKGKVRETKLALTAASLSACVTAALPPAVHSGTINTAAGTYTGTHQWETPRQTLDTVTTAFGVEYRVNGDATVDVGTQAQLYRATPTTILSARGAGADLDVKSIGTDFQPGATAVDYTTRAVLLGQTTDSQAIVEATADAPSVPYLDLWGNTVAFTRMISDSGQTTGSATAAVQLQLNRFNRLATAVKVTAEDYEIAGEVVVGDNAWVYDPDNGIVDTSHELDFRGEKINPAVVRISAATWPVTADHTVAFRTQAGTVIDLTRWVVWESGTTSLTIGDLPKTLTTGGNPVQDRANSVPDASVPNAPTGLTLATTSVQDTKGNLTATVAASWTAPTTNTDGSVVTDLSHYLVQYRPQFRAPLWFSTVTASTSIDLPGLAAGLVYDVEVAAVDLAGHVSGFTAVSSITAAPDSTAPNPPSDPVVSSYLGQLRIAWDGKDNTGAAMPADFAIVEVHVSATSGFTPVRGPGSTTLVDQLSTAGVSYATAPYGSSRFVKLVAVDNSQNASSPSGQVTGSTTQVADGDIAALSVGKLTAGTMSADVVVGGRFATALTGGRVEMNSLGFQKFDTDGVTKLVSITGTEALLTGIIKTALSGRRVEIGASGSTGSVDFYAPDGTLSQVQGYTASTGAEGVSLGLPFTGANYLWNRLILQHDELSAIYARQFIVNIGGNTTTGGDRLFAVNYATGRGNSTTLPPTQVVMQAGVAGFSIQDSTGSNPLFVGRGGGTSNWASFYPDGSKVQSRLDIMPIATFTGSQADDRSPAVEFVSETNFGLRLHFYAPGGALEVAGPSDSTFLPINASAFNVNSDSVAKTGIRKLEHDPTELIRGMEIVQFRRKRGAGPTTTPKRVKRDAVPGEFNMRDVPPPMAPPAPDHDEVGVLAEHTHDLLRRTNGASNFVDLGSTLFTAIAALQQALGRIDRLEEAASA